MPSQTFQDLQVWQKAHAWVLDVYRLTSKFPREELFGLTSQLRRAAVSIPANIAEGFKKRGKADKARFFNISQGSLEECRYYLLLARDLRYANTDGQSVAIDEISRMLDSYIRAIIGPPRFLTSVFCILSSAFSAFIHSTSVARG
jgi:four helix bundle protein